MKLHILQKLALLLIPVTLVVAGVASPAKADDRHISPSFLYPLSAHVYCNHGQGTVVVPAQNTLQPAAGGVNDLLVTAQIGEDGPTADTYRLVAQGWHQFAVETGQPIVTAGHVKFAMTWPDGSGYNDEQAVGYAGKDCRYEVAPTFSKSTPTCRNRTMTVKGDAKPGLSWDPATLSLEPGESGTLSATLDETVAKLVPGIPTSYTVKNAFVCRLPHAKINHLENGDPWARLNNERSEVAVKFHATATYRGKLVYDRTFTVEAGKSHKVSFGVHRRFEPGTKFVIKSVYNHTILASGSVPEY